MSNIVCQVCFKSLTTHSSIVAGMGPVCRERLRFAEQASLEELETMKGPAEVANSRSLLPFRNVILQDKVNNAILSSILGVNNGTIIFIDRQKLNRLYQNSQGSYSEVFAQCINIMANHEVATVHAIEKPDHPQFQREFTKFSKNHKKKIEEREEIIAKNLNYELDYSFGNIESTRELSLEQKNNRDEMMTFKAKDTSSFNQLFATAEYHMATFLKRLENADFSELLAVRKIVLKRYTPKIDVKDYGLTSSEIVSGLQSANKGFEKNLFRAFSEGNTNLVGITEIFQKQEFMEPKDKLLSTKVVQLLTQDKYMTQGHKDTVFYDQAREFIKRHKITVHVNWLK